MWSKTNLRILAETTLHAKNGGQGCDRSCTHLFFRETGFLMMKIIKRQRHNVGHVT